MRALLCFLILLLFSGISCYLSFGTSQNVLNNYNDDQIEFRGMTFVGDKYCPEVNYTDDLSVLSMQRLSFTGANWVAIVVTEYQDKMNSTDIYPLYTDFMHSDYFTYKTETIDGIKKMINAAKDFGLKVMLKPHIDLTKEPPRFWRGDIGKGMNDEDVVKWFASYEKYMIKYAKLAEEMNVEMFSISCELIEMSKYEQNWRQIVKVVRANYKGILTDSANWGGEEMNKKWWDVLDYIGVDAYYLPIFANLTKSNLTIAESYYNNILNDLESLSNTFKKDVIITEIGFCSGNCDRKQVATSFDHFIQAEFYHIFYKTFAKRKFIKGFFWWAWNSDPYFGGTGESCISPQYKIAEQILRDVYKSPYKMDWEPAKPPKCICTI